MVSQLNHHWIDWAAFSRDYLRLYPYSVMIPTNIESRVICTLPEDGSSMAHYLVEFHSPYSGKHDEKHKVDPSLARFVFPNLHYRQWHRPGGSLTLLNTFEATDWIAENLTAPIRGVQTGRLLYLTSDSRDDIILAKLRFGVFDPTGTV